MYAAAAAGETSGGYATVADAAEALAKLKDEVYQPDRDNAEIYDRLYELYRETVAVFNPKENPVLKALRELRI